MLKYLRFLAINSHTVFNKLKKSTNTDLAKFYPDYRESEDESEYSDEESVPSVEDSTDQSTKRSVKNKVGGKKKGSSKEKSEDSDEEFEDQDDDESVDDSDDSDYGFVCYFKLNITFLIQNNQLVVYLCS